MRIVPLYIWTPPLRNGNNRGRSIARLREALSPEAFAARRFHPRWQADQVSRFLDRILSNFRVLIVEGISGSGKDTFQTYLKENLQRRGRDVYDYSEGELLQSWNQLQIKGIFDLQISLMKLFSGYMKEVVNRDEKAVFLLNRFHLSAYILAVTKHPHLRKKYDQTIHTLRTLPAHVFILQLDKDEIERRSLHPERSGAWQKFQEQIVKKDGFQDRLERYIWQQRSMLQLAYEQKIPYSVIKLPSEPEMRLGWAPERSTSQMVSRGVGMNAEDAKTPRGKLGITRTH